MVQGASHDLMEVTSCRQTLSERISKEIDVCADKVCDSFGPTGITPMQSTQDPCISFRPKTQHRHPAKVATQNPPSLGIQPGDSAQDPAIPPKTQTSSPATEASLHPEFSLPDRLLVRFVAYHYFFWVVAYHCLQAFWRMARRAFSGRLAHGCCAGPPEIHTSWTLNTKCGSWANHRLKL